MINYIKLQNDYLSFPDRRAPVMIQCSTQRDIDAVVRRLMLLKCLAGKGLSARDAMRMSGYYVRGKENFCLWMRSNLFSDSEDETVLYQVEIAEIPPDGFDVSEKIEVKEDSNPTVTVEKRGECIDIRGKMGCQLRILESRCDKSVISLASDLFIVWPLRDFIEKWFFYMPVPSAPQLSFETSGEDVTDITLWLHHLLKQESNRDCIPRLVSLVHPCMIVSTQYSEDGVRVNLTLPETRALPYQTLNYVVGVVTVLLSDHTSFVVLVKPERFIPAKKEEDFLRMVCEAMQNKDVAIITQSQTMFQISSYRYRAEESEDRLFLTAE